MKMEIKIIGVFGLVEAMRAVGETAHAVFPTWVWGFVAGTGLATMVSGVIAKRGAALGKGVFWLLVGGLGAFGTVDQIGAFAAVWAYAALVSVAVAAGTLGVVGVLKLKDRGVAAVLANN